MIVMVDDVQFKNEESFYLYISKSLGVDEGVITNENQLYDVLSEYDQELEIIVHDYDDIEEQSKKFARKIAEVLMDCRLANKKLKVEFMQGEENFV